MGPDDLGLNPLLKFRKAQGGGGGGTNNSPPADNKPPANAAPKTIEDAVKAAIDKNKGGGGQQQTYTDAQVQSVAHTTASGNVEARIGGTLVSFDKVGPNQWTAGHFDQGGAFQPYNGPLTGVSSGVSPGAGSTAKGPEATPGYDPGDFAKWGGSVIYPTDGSAPYGMFDGVSYSLFSDGKLHPSHAEVDPAGPKISSGGTPPYPNATGQQTQKETKPGPPGYTDADFATVKAGAPYTVKTSGQQLRTVNGVTYALDPTDKKWYASGSTDPLAALLAKAGGPAKTGGTPTSSTALPGLGGTAGSTASAPATGTQTTGPYTVQTKNDNGVGASTDPETVPWMKGSNPYAVAAAASGHASGADFGEPPGGTKLSPADQSYLQDNPYGPDNPLEKAALSGAAVKPAFYTTTGSGTYFGNAPSTRSVPGEAGGGDIGGAALPGMGSQRPAGGHVTISEPSVVIPARELQPGQHPTVQLGEVRPEELNDHGDGRVSVQDHVAGTDRYDKMLPGMANGGGFDNAVLGVLRSALFPYKNTLPNGVSSYQTWDNGRQRTNYLNPATGATGDSPYDVDEGGQKIPPPTPVLGQPGSAFYYNPGGRNTETGTTTGLAGGGDMQVAAPAPAPEAFGMRGLPGMVRPAAAIGGAALRALANAA